MQPLHPLTLFELDSGVPAEPVAAVEYFHAGHEQYLVTTLPDEMAMLDRGEIAGWARTSQMPAFQAFDNRVRARYVLAAQAMARPVCRYFVPPASHFLSVSEAECEAVGRTYPQSVLETNAAFCAWEPAPDGAGLRPFARIGGFAFVPVYRLWNAHADTNHRYTANKAGRDAMVAEGWVSEGYGAEGVAMCVPRWG